MGFLDTVLGRSKPVKADLDDLFALPSAALTLEAALGFKPTGLGSVCFKAAEGAAFAQTQADVQQLLDAFQAGDGPKVEVSKDTFGYTWLLVRHDPDDIPGLVTDLHAVNSGLQDAGFGPQLLCSLISFAHPDGRRLALVYLYKRGTFYPFVPLGEAQKRDNALEIEVQGALANDMKVEPDLTRWFPVWGAPGL
ncbi:MAG: hypothetical protein QOH29_1796 [Actinomycetota bacterium]|jgi:hypothetical protein|nr:hypothetical protein [Actinomycetota bacterium]